ncbi:MAG: hypothetical protein WDO68_21490 [Gammaproteobacteria bacterium]
MGEAVVLSVDPTPPRSMKVTWTLDTDGGDFLNGATGRKVILTAGEKASHPRVTASIAGASLPTVIFEVVEPASEAATGMVSIDVYLDHCAAAGMHLTVQVNPSDVSFQNVEIQERSAPATNIAGRFAQMPPAALAHQASPRAWFGLLPNNITYDTAALNYVKPPWGEGRFELDIPVKWKLKGTSRKDPDSIHSLPQQLQTASMKDEGGAVTVSKMGKEITRMPSQRPGTWADQRRCIDRVKEYPALYAAALCLGAACAFPSESVAQSAGAPIEQVAQLERAWKRGDGAQQYEYFAEAGAIASELYKYDREQADPAALTLLNNLLKKRNKPGDVGAADLVAATRVARFILGNPAGTPEARESQLAALSKMLGKVRAEVDLTYVPKRVFVNVPPPGDDESRGARTDADSISSSKARKQYQTALRENLENDVTNQRQAELFNMDDEFSTGIVGYLSDQIADSSISDSRVAQIMNDAKFTEAERIEVTSVVEDRRRLATR